MGYFHFTETRIFIPWLGYVNCRQHLSYTTLMASSHIRAGSRDRKGLLYPEQIEAKQLMAAPALDDFWKANALKNFQECRICNP